MSEYVNIQDGARLLGETAHKFHYHVERGEIGIEPGSPRNRRRYRVSDILAVKERLSKKKRKAKPVLLDWMYAADVPAGLKLSMLLYPGEVNLATAAVYQAWRKNNPYLTMAAYSPDRQECYATIQVVPLPEQVILDVLAGRREEESITPDEIQGYDRPGAYTLLVTSATCRKDHPQLLFQVIYKYIQFWIEQYPERYIRRVYAQAVSEDGMRIVQHFFMSPRLDLAHNAFMLDLAYPPVARILREFKHRLAEIAPLPADLQWSAESHSEGRETPAPLERIKQQPIAAQRQPRTRQRGADLPEGCVLFTPFFRQHGIAETTARRSIGKDFQLIEEYRAGFALDRQGQHSFYEKFHQHSSFTPCPDCPHTV